MIHVLHVVDKSGRKIHLSKERWKHIITKHPDMAEKLHEIEATLAKPALIVPHHIDDDMRNYYRQDKHKKHYLLVAVKYLNGEGFVATAFSTKNIRRK